MLFNSLAYFIFFPVVFFLYWRLGQSKLKYQNGFLLLVSYFFYSQWDWRFLSLILASTLIDYSSGIKIHQNQGNISAQKIWLWLSILFNLTLLGFFKYYNFFTDSFLDFLQMFGYRPKSVWLLNIILPVGISFYTFQTMSYSLDIYFGRLKPTRNLLNFATFIAFFPQLVAGPIERASNLLPQISEKRKFNYEQSVEGLKLILWGLFKKVVIADSIAPMVDDIFQNYETYSASTLVLGITLFSFQVYGDFSGYSDIAIGSSKMLGIELKSNFRFPHFSRNVAEYWQRWHTSLSTWFRHYLYIPLGGSRVSKLNSIRNICVVFLVSGLWHGANWTFVFWGAFHAMAFIPVFLLGRNTIYKHSTVAENSVLPSFMELLQLILTFSLVTFSRIFFRSTSITDAFGFIGQIVNNFDFEYYQHPEGYRMVDYFILLIVFTLYEFRIRKDERNPFKFKSRFVRFVIYTIVIFCLLLFYDDSIDRSFIYFQF
ncbi:MBOAT family O-acyltransferase [Flagellimonas sp.]|jgi:alginate O-acetyltransferase complex protein AlgI|uniref:MBOAT family O-acyltransferase n=1 Tax=Flagellimonas sp. TaxID=2058762 RepID=UPI003BAADCFA